MSNNLQTINNQFEFNFPIDFVSDEIEKRYKPYLKAKRKIHSTVRDYLNSTILDISFPGITFNTISNEQVLHRKKIKWKAVDNIYDLYEKTATLTVQNVDSNINFFILQDILTDKYLDIDKTYDENINLTVVDENRNALFQIQFRSVIWTNISGTSFGFNKQQMGSNTFTIEFTYNYIDIEWVNDHSDIIVGNIL